MAREQDFISEVRTEARNLWNSVNRLKALQREHTALAYGDSLPAGVGANDGITKAEVGSVLFDTTDAIVAVFDAGHATNVAKLL